MINNNTIMALNGTKGKVKYITYLINFDLYNNQSMYKIFTWLDYYIKFSTLSVNHDTKTARIHVNHEQYPDIYKFINLIKESLPFMEPKQIKSIEILEVKGS